MSKLVKLGFSGFWPNFDKKNNPFTHLLARYFEIEISDDPDFLIYSVFEFDHTKYSKPVKIFYTGENVLPDFLKCDFALSFSYINSDRHYRLPLYWYRPLYYLRLDSNSLIEENEHGSIGIDVLRRDNESNLVSNLDNLTQPRNITIENLSNKEGFCSFLTSNPISGKYRTSFFRALSTYRKVHSGGKYFNNIGEPVLNKTDFLKKHKFHIAFENSSSPGYTTEKIVEAYLSETIPIYWGNKLVGQDFNKKAFICVHDFDGITDVINKVIELDNDNDQFLEMLNQPLFKDNDLNQYIKEGNIIAFFETIFEDRVNERKIIKDYSYWQTYLLRRSLSPFKKISDKVESLSGNQIRQWDSRHGDGSGLIG